MKQTVTKFLSVLLSAALLCTFIPGQFVFAEEPAVVTEAQIPEETVTDDLEIQEAEQVETTDSIQEQTADSVQQEEQKDVSEESNTSSETVTQTQESVSEEAESTVETQENVTEDVKESDSEILLNYFYVESPELESSATQNIVVSWGDGSEQLDDMQLVSTSDYGEEIIWECSKHQDNLYLFSREFTEDEIGIHEFVEIRYSSQGSTYNAVLSEGGIEAVFAVGGSALTYSMYSNTEEAAVATVSEVENAETEVANALAEALGETESSNPGDIIVVLDPGHDDVSPGAHYDGYAEEDLVLKIAYYCKEELEKYPGVKVYMTRYDGSCPAGISTDHSEREGDCLQKRIDIAADKDADILLSFHLNAFGNSGANGAEVYYPNDNWKPGIGNAGHDVAQSIQKELVSIGLADRGIKDRTSTDDEDNYPDNSQEDYYAICRKSKIAGFPGLIIEHAFISGAYDQAHFLSTERGLKALGTADARGIIDFYNLDGKKGKWIETPEGWKYKQADGTFVTDRWMTISGYRYCFYKNGTAVTGVRKIGRYTYYFNDQCQMQTYWQEDNGKTYYLDQAGHMYFGMQMVEGKMYYFDPVTGVMNDGPAGWTEIEGKKYYRQADGSLARDQWLTIDGYRYCFYRSGAPVVGFRTIGRYRYYFDDQGRMQTGWKDIAGKTYYFDGSGHMYKGVHQIDGKDYTFNSETGELMTNVSCWEESNGKWYYIKSDGTYAKDQWLTIDGHRYCFYRSGAAVVGFRTIGSHRYYFDDHGRMQTGWQRINGKRYYFNGSGHMYKGTHTIDGRSYTFSRSTGELLSKKTGWEQSDGKWYYVKSNGTYAKDQWLTTGGYRYCFYRSGAAVVGFRTIGGHRYYFDDRGRMKTGWQKINGKKYYFDGSGHMYMGIKTVGKKVYDFDPETGALIENQEGWKESGGKRYYRRADGSFVSDQWMTKDGYRYCFYRSGAAVVGYRTIGGTMYYFDELGRMEMHRIAGETEVTAEQLVEAYMEYSPIPYPSEELKKGGAETLEEFCQIFMEEAMAEELKPEVVFAQSMLETSWLQYGGSVKIEQFNFAGLGAVDSKAEGKDFSEFEEDGVRMGVRAQVQHLKAYASSTITKETLAYECVDDRFQYVTPGSAEYVEWLGINENPQGKGWAAGEKYGESILRIVDQIKALKAE